MMTRKEERTYIEILETTIPVPQKLSALLGRDNYLAFIRLLDGWKKRIINVYKNAWNYDGKALALFVKHCFAIIKQYHTLAIARFGEKVDTPELITKLSASVQSLFIKEIVSELEFVPVEYNELSEETVADPETVAYTIFLERKKLKPPSKSMAGFVYYSMIYYMLDVLEFAYLWLKKSLKYHMRKYYSDDTDYHAELLLYQQNMSKKDLSDMDLLQAILEEG